MDDADLDVEVIALAGEFYRRLGLRQIDLVVNSLGEPDDRARYVERATMDQQRILPLDSLESDGAPYFSMILIHRRGEAWT